MALIEPTGLTKHYGPVKALEKLDLAVEPGIIGLVGANGAGKSTLLKILLGLIPPTSGRPRFWAWTSVREAGEIRKVVGYMPEHDCLPPDVGATEFVTHMARISGLPRTAARERTAEVLRHVGLYEERYRQIGGYSTGMKQRVKLAQALVHDPKLLLLDEPTNGLDPAGRDEMLDLIKRTGNEFGITVVVASHLLGEIEQVCTSCWPSTPAICCRPRRSPLHPADAGPRGRGGGRAPIRWRALTGNGFKARLDGMCVLVALEDDASTTRSATRSRTWPAAGPDSAGARPPGGPLPRRRPGRRGCPMSAPIATVPAPPAALPAGSIYDLGYRHYEGKRHGRCSTPCGRSTSRASAASGVSAGR
jgi:ABC-type Na+ transport system ATPase subunit NatA